MKDQFLIDRILNDIEDGVIVIGFDGTILLHNPAAERMLGMTADLLGKTSIVEIMRSTDANDELFELILQAVYTKNKVEKTIPYLRDGETLYLRITTDFLTNGTEKVGVIAHLIDITEAATLFIANQQLTKQITDLMDSFVKVMVTAIDEKSPYNAHHTKNMVQYAKRYLNYLSGQGTLAKHTAENTSPLLMSIWLHDIGKLLVPPEIMDKPTRLGAAEKDVLHRIETALLMLNLRSLTCPSEAAQCQSRTEELLSAKELIMSANTAGFLSEETIGKLRSAARIECMTADGERIPLLNDTELEAITVVRGTLTAEERKIIESHVSLTAKLLSKMQFHGVYRAVPLWAGGHHELLDGSGYPQHLKAEDIPWETRLLTVIDVYDALTADDRPYKPPMPPEKAFAILREMADSGKVDLTIVNSFFDSGAWQKEADDLTETEA
ncbi:MAG: PAS domain S-box protein [Oscillospiraceae bacterium]|nr:PAS domain S-box protein [Oscillospiraceae bacterium]